jgi:hypothetical protein
MSKSTLSIEVRTMNGLFSQNPRTVEVPCRLPDSFNFKFGGRTRTAEISDASKAGFANSYVCRVEHDGETPPTAEEFTKADAHATAILATIKATLGITGPVPHGSPLTAIALAYEAEVKAFDAQVRAYDALPAIITAGSSGLVDLHPADTMSGPESSPAARMLAKYVEYVVQNAAARMAP